ncbi:MAG: ABC transporter permease [Proteobacteria bacterium]|nr:ABC transporter permease [Pseudomonadota bacterium]
MWRRIVALVVKEFLAVLKDRKSRAVLLVLPFLQLGVFPFATTFEVTGIRLAVLNEDAGAEGRELVSRFTATPTFRAVATLTHSSEIAPMIDSRRAELVLHVGKTFSRALKTGASAPVQLIADGRNSNTALITLAYAGEIVGAFGREHARAPLPAALVDRAWFNPNLGSLWSILPGILAIIISVATTSITAFSLAREKEVGTFQQLLVTPLRPVEIVIGKTLPALAIGLGESAVIVAAMVLLYRMPLVGRVGLLYVGIPLFLLANIGMGLMVSSVARTQQQALLGAFLFLLPEVILSGFATPIGNMPDWIQTLTYVNPMRYFLVISQGVFLKDLPADAVLAQAWPMALIALGSLTVAGWLFRRRLY